MHLTISSLLHNQLHFAIRNKCNVQHPNFFRIIKMHYDSGINIKILKTFLCTYEPLMLLVMSINSASFRFRITGCNPVEFRNNFFLCHLKSKKWILFQPAVSNASINAFTEIRQIFHCCVVVTITMCF